MTIWYKGFTYIPKIAGVRSGQFKQTIREAGDIHVVDTIVWHGWEHGADGGRIGFWNPGDKCSCEVCRKVMSPYKEGKWSWRLSVIVADLIDMIAMQDHVLIPRLSNDKISWDSDEMDTIAMLDGISPPNGLVLRDLFIGMYGLKEPRSMHIIRWQ